MSDDEYYEFCVANPDVCFERSPQGEIIIVPPAGGESDYRCVDAASQLKVWSKEDGRGKPFGSSVEFIIEVMSPTDHLKAAREKMTAWLPTASNSPG
jgi:Uma2 family endonuclease